MDIPLDRPVTPPEAAALKHAVIPPAVLAAFNKLILLHWEGTYAEFPATDVLPAVSRENSSLAPGLVSAAIAGIAPAYRAAGWSVTFDRPGYNETYEAHWIFRRAS
jgi:hypothetical protein